MNDKNRHKLLLSSIAYLCLTLSFCGIIYGESRQSPAISSKFTLLITLYNEQNAERINEYISCLEYNLVHPSIETIEVMYDSSKDRESKKHILLDYLKQKPIRITYITGRPTYGDCFTLANTYYPSSRIILSNADIYFNKTLTLLEGYNLTNKFLALTRWNVLKDGGIEIFKQYYRGRFWKEASESSQDVWIFQTPLIKFPQDNVHMGVRSCDTFISEQAQRAQLEVINPCLTIQCCHLHLSEIRNYDENAILVDHHVPIEWVTL